MATTQNRTFYGGSTAPGSGVYPEDVKVLKVFANYAETDYDPLANSDTSVYIPTVDKHSHDDGNIVSIIDRILAAGGSPIVTKLGAEFIYASGDTSEYKFVNVSGDNITEMTINRTTGTVTTQNNFPARPVEVEYIVSTASDVAAIINAKGLPYMKVGESIARLYKIEPSKYTFRTTNLRTDGDINYLDIVDYIVNGFTWTTVTKTVSSGETGTAYLKKVSSPASFDTTGLSGLQTVAGVNDVPNDGVYQVSVMMSVTPKTANATKSDLVFGFYGADGIGMADRAFHAVVDDSQTFAQQLSFSTTLNLKAGANSLKLSCDGLNTNYLVFVDDLTVAQLVNGVYHNGDDFADVHTLTEAANFNNDDGVLVDGATGGPRFMLWRTLANKVLGFIKSLPTTITAFRTGDVIPVDGPDGTAKMSKDNLLKATAVKALGSIHSLSDTATEADLVEGNYIALDGEGGTKRLPAYLLGGGGEGNGIVYINLTTTKNEVYDIVSRGKLPVMQVVAGQGYNYFYPSWIGSGLTFVHIGRYGVVVKMWDNQVGGWTDVAGYDTTLSSDSTNAVQNATLYAVIGNIETLLAAL